MRSRYFWKITRRQALSPVTKFHHVLGRGFMVKRVILIFIKCLLSNHNRLSADASPNMIFFKDPLYFRITPLSVYITNIITFVT